MKRLIFLWLVGSSYLQAQDQLLNSSRNTKPSWVGQPQTAVDEYYFYGIGQANNLIEAKEIAAKDVIIDTFKKQKCTISLDEINKTTQKQKGETFEIEGQYYSIMHTKCKDISTEGYNPKDFYWEQWKQANGQTFYRYYLWVSLPKAKLVSLKKALAYSIFPGGGQMYKIEYGRFAAIWGGLILSAGGASYCLIKANENRDIAAGFPSIKYQRDKYQRYESNWRLGIVACGVAAVSVYIINLYDANHHKNKRIRTASTNNLKLLPYYAANHGGLMLSYSLHPQK
ncbi:hypothetical protein [Runella salmonicolor]|uniref:DUF5683 domain-containing protein n=1 Tax=Runella salmonicolor TaxID=2950278 RepID=A0ABT1FWV1_9BACT|nr:hypothetical protein [Runella salmonicolor]MCP1386243.1 hypothetical protein [Runella salmonicolor]